MVSLVIANSDYCDALYILFVAFYIDLLSVVDIITIDAAPPPIIAP